MGSPPAATPGAAAVVLVSGGLDSCVTAAIAAAEHDRALGLLHVNYGQRTETREQASFREIAAHFGVSLCLEVDGSFLSQIGGSSLTDPTLPIPDAGANGRGVPSTYVPFRNALFLAIAVAWAEVIGATEVYIGAHEEGTAYPDCRAGFFSAFQSLVRCGVRPGANMAIQTPLLEMGKGDIVGRGIALGAPLHLTWSCYRNGERPCNTCSSCALRRLGFEAAGVRDPLLDGGG